MPGPSGADCDDPWLPADDCSEEVCSEELPSDVESELEESEEPCEGELAEDSVELELL